MQPVKLGEVITDTETRDAIHIAVAPVVAGKRLHPGEHIGLTDQETAAPTDNPIGIVDPFLKHAVDAGERFWMLLYPQTITTLRHYWEHPAFKTHHITHDFSMSRDWMTAYAVNLRLTYEELMAAAKNFVEHGEYFSQGGRFEGVYADDEFWDHYETLTGSEVPENQRGSLFSCSC